MAYPGVLDDLRTCARRRKPSRVPVFVLGEEFDVEQYGVDYREYIVSAERMVECQVQAVQRFDYDWILLHPDDYIEFEPLGVQTTAAERIPPAAVSHVPATREALRALQLPDPTRDGRMPIHLEALSGIKSAFGDSLCVAGRVAAPFSSVGLLCGVQESLFLLRDDPDLFRDMMEFCGELTMVWAVAQIEAGADAIWLGDCVASSGFLSPQHYADFAVEPAKWVSDAMRADGAVVIYHAGEDSLAHLTVAAPHFEIINVGEGADLAQVKAAIGHQVCLSGNADPIKLMNCSGLSQVEAETQRIVEAGKPGGGYLFNTGEGIPRQTRPEVVQAMVQTAQRCGRY
jgi:uroporphyrinogen decarboxylase